MIIILESFGIVIAAKYAEMAVNQNKTEVDCSYFPIVSENEVVLEYQSGVSDNEKYKRDCFCENLLMTQPTKIDEYMIEDISKEVPVCRVWFTDYVKTKSIRIGIILMIPAINAILSIMMNSKIY